MLNKVQKKTLFILRISMGWLFLYAGLVKVFDPTWSAKGFLKNAETFSGFYEWLAQPALLPWVNVLNQWGLTLIGVSLILGLLTRFSSITGVILMILYYFPSLNFPYAGEHSFIIDNHFIYIIVLLVLYIFETGKIWGLDQHLEK